jgi:hypothetical protein
MDGSSILNWSIITEMVHRVKHKFLLCSRKASGNLRNRPPEALVDIEVPKEFPVQGKPVSKCGNV